MRKNGIYDLNDLQDRRIMMEKKLPPYGYAFVLIVAAFMVFLVVWSTQTPRVYVSQCTGSVQASNKTYIMSTYSGSISELNISEGSYVNEGDLIAHIKSTDLDMQQSNIQSQIDIYQTQLEQFNKLLRSIQDDRNYFSETDPNDQTYYYQYETYKSQVAQKAFDPTPYQAAGYSDAQIKALMEQNQSEIESLYYSTLQNITSNINQVQSQIDNLKSQMDALSTGANDYYIYAPTSGVIHMDTAYKEGMVLGSGSVLATVASQNDDLEIVAYVTMNDRPLLNAGDPCKIAVSGLSEYTYGTITGTVTSIDSDVTNSQNGSYYKMTVTPDNTYVVGKSGDKVNLTNGMGVTVRVEYDKVTYFEYVMEAFGVLFR
ncbi:MAG: HlyD family secretion protein [Faecalibacterium sp.]